MINITNDQAKLILLLQHKDIKSVTDYKKEVMKEYVNSKKAELEAESQHIKQVTSELNNT